MKDDFSGSVAAAGGDADAGAIGSTQKTWGTLDYCNVMDLLVAKAYV